MERVTNFIRKILGLGMGIGTVFLIGMMILIVLNIIYRLFGHIIPGSVELSELLIVVAVSFALSYAAIKESHVVVRVVVSRFPQRKQAVVKAIMSLISFFTWGAITWTSVYILSERWLQEVTSILDIPILPFRFVWLFGLVLLCFVYLIDLVKALKEVIWK